jgi:hypothetical protein
MDFPNIDNQHYSEKTLRGFLLKNLNSNPRTPADREINDYLIRKVDIFWDEVVVPLRKDGRFDPAKINWYFEIYREGSEARKVQKYPFEFLHIDEDMINKIIRRLKDLTLQEYVELGSSYLSNAHLLLSAWLRDRLVLTRLEHIYCSDEPYKWIIRAEEEENGVMKQGLDVPDLPEVLSKIGLILSRRV